MNIIAWAIVTVVCLIIEFVTAGEFITIWFALGALLATIISAFSFSTFTIEAIVFISAGLLTLLFIRPVCIKLLKNNDQKTNLDTIVDTKVKIIKPVSPDEMGTAKLEGVIWNVVSEGNMEIAEGVYCKVIKIEGNKLIVKPIEND